MDPYEITYDKLLWLKLFDSYNNNLKMTNIGVYSITKPFVALKCIIYILLYSSKKKINIQTALDATAGLGGITRYLYKFIPNIISIEKNSLHFNICKSNLDILYPKNTITFINNTFVSLIDSLEMQDLIICDPPWGGPEYKNSLKCSLYLDNINVYIIINKLFKLKKCKIFALISMYNYNYDDLLQLDNNIYYTIYNIRNISLICFSLTK